MLSHCVFNVKPFVYLSVRKSKIKIMKTALSLILLFFLGTLVSAQEVQILPSGEQVQIDHIADKSNYSFSRFDAAGKLIESGSYKAGMPDGVWINYNTNGTISGKGSYRNGKKDGDWSIYTLDGSPAYMLSYQEGIRKAAFQLDERGNTLAETKTKE
jgi:antitoxin component YwqK of YwqJK toxin-antitoxin module